MSLFRNLRKFVGSRADRRRSGPAYFEGLNVFGPSSRITWSVNLGNNTIGFAQAAVKGVSPLSSY